MAAISYDKYNANVHRTGSSLKCSIYLCQWPDLHLAKCTANAQTWKPLGRCAQ